MERQPKKLIEPVEKWFRRAVLDAAYRDKVADIVSYAILALVCGFMTFVSVITDDPVQMVPTLIFMILCIFNLLVVRFSSKKAAQIVHYAFVTEVIIMLVIFIVTGTPDGFSGIWAAMTPFVLYTRSDGKESSITCLIILAICIFFFWTPVGRSLLLYEYTESWMLRIPVFYIGVLSLAGVLHYIEITAIRELNALRNSLQEEVRAQTEELVKKNERLETMNDEIIEAIGSIVEGRNLETGNHVFRVKKITQILGETLQKLCPQHGLTDEDIKRITSASAVHDIGKIMISDTILLKPGRLDKEEFEEMKKHADYGSKMLNNFSNIWDEEYGSTGRDICRYHHERWDGRGYPCGLKGDEIPISAQLVAIADVYDALTNERIYKPAFTHEEACRMILAGECGAFSPEMLDCFTKCKERLLETLKS